jgi:hypothetical protein
LKAAGAMTAEQQKKEAGPPVCYFDMRKQANITHQQDQPCLLFCQAFIPSINTFLP